VSNCSSCATEAQLTAFHHILGHPIFAMAIAAAILHLRRSFTQNIDCIETKLPSLPPDEKSGKGSFPATWQLYGRIDQMICQFCKQYLPFNPQLFHGYKMPLCFHARSRYRNIPRKVAQGMEYLQRFKPRVTPGLGG